MIRIFDIETDGLYQEATKLHCISIKGLDEETAVYTSQPLKGSSGTLEEGLDLLSKATLLVGHNIINFDIPTIKKLYPTWDYKECLDTLIMSRLAFPDRLGTDLKSKAKNIVGMPTKLKGSHSLKAWGYRLGILKGDFGAEDDWSTLTTDMIEYCRQDSDVTYKLYKDLLKSEVPEEAMLLEQAFAKIISRQEKYGVYFDVVKANKMHVELLEELDKATELLDKTFTPLQDWKPLNEPSKYTKSGTLNKVRLKQEESGAYLDDKLGWGRYDIVTFNPGSRHHIVRWLKEVYNWRPKKFTEKGTPIIDDVVLNELDFKEGKILAHYFTVNKLLGQLYGGKNAWMKFVDSNNRIHGSVNTLGAVSRRCTHSRPNMAQVPSGRAYKGHEARDLFCVPKGKKLVGCDADGLELRTLSHYMARYDAGAYAVAVDQGDKDLGTDIHTLNQKSAGLPTRDDAKTFIYAFLYGAGDEKIGAIVGGSKAQGKNLKAKFLRQLPALAKLTALVTSTVSKTKTLKALDGNKYHIRSSHSALNTLLQGAGALVMKYYLVFLDRNLQQEFTFDKQYEFVLNVHDEVQIECDEDIAERVAKICETTFNDVTKYLNFRIPLRGTAAIGSSWAETH